MFNRNAVTINNMSGEGVVQDYCQMLSPENNREMQAFAIQSLDQIIDEAIKKIMNSSELLMMTL